MATAQASAELQSVEKALDKARQSQPVDITSNAEIGKALTTLLADTFALYIKTKNFHWHISGPHFRDYHLLLDSQSEQIIAIVDAMGERVRKIGQPTLRSIEQIAGLKRLASSEAEDLSAEQMLTELYADNQALISYMRATHQLASDNNDVATTSLLEEWIDQAEERAWFLHETLKK